MKLIHITRPSGVREAIVASYVVRVGGDSRSSTILLSNGDCISASESVDEVAAQLEQTGPPDVQRIQMAAYREWLQKVEESRAFLQGLRPVDSIVVGIPKPESFPRKGD